jgi:hypothetical protein
MLTLFLARWLFYTDDGGDTVLRVVGCNKSHKASHPRRRHHSSWEWRSVTMNNLFLMPEASYLTGNLLLVSWSGVPIHSHGRQIEADVNKGRPIPSSVWARLHPASLCDLRVEKGVQPQTAPHSTSRKRNGGFQNSFQCSPVIFPHHLLFYASISPS